MPLKMLRRGRRVNKIAGLKSLRPNFPWQGRFLGCLKNFFNALFRGSVCFLAGRTGLHGGCSPVGNACTTLILYPLIPQASSVRLS